MSNRNYFGPPASNEIDCPVCGKRTSVRQSGSSWYIATHLDVVDGSPETCQGSRNPVSERSVRP